MKTTVQINNIQVSRFVLFLILMVVAPAAGWGQDYSGVYYIASNYRDTQNNAQTPYNSGDLAGNLYLCPTEPTSAWNWYYGDPNKAVNDNTGEFFMTTFKCHSNSYSDENAVWIVEKHPSQNYYYIKRAIDNSYLTYNGSITSPSGVGANRMRVHTESATPNPNNSSHDIYLFAITPYGSDGAVNISAKSAINITNNDVIYLNINKGNRNSLVGSGNAEGNIALGGIIGLWSGQDAFSEWRLEQATIDPPTITNNFNGTITITTETGATIYYTTDGTNPTTSTTTTGITSVTFPLANGVTVIKAIAKSNSDYFPTYVSTYHIPVCEKPVITVNNSTATITCATPGASMFYTTNDTPATTSSTPYADPFSTAGVDVIRAIAASPGYLISNEAFYYPPMEVSSSTQITNMNGHYILLEGFTSSASIGTADNPFSGQIDGNYVPFTLNGHALIGVAEDAVIKNVVVSNVDYSGSGNVGAIVNTAKGGTKVYNCGVQGGSVSGGTNTGGLVGLIEAGSSVRVVNCYNFANVSGSAFAAGIVGKNEGTVAADKTVGNVRIALCMMYGNVTGATNISPVYTGNHVSNSKNFTEYNYWRYRSGLTYTPGAYNDQMAIERDDFLTRFPFYLHILNTHREMAAFFLFGAVTCNNVGDIDADNINEIGHWVLKNNVAAYPIIEPWPTDTRKVLDAPTPSNILTGMGSNGYLSVSVKIGSHTYSANLPITDMDEANYDYTWGKVVLPFANEFEVNTDYTKICTGWKITSVSPAGQESFENYNVSNRKCTTKDLFSTTGFIFAQGGNYIVPYGVTAIEITANFATAYYLRDASYEIAYEGDNSGGTNSGYKTRTPLGGDTPGTYQGRPVYNTLAAALGAMVSSGSTHDQAVVLVGNFHMDSEDLSGKTAKGYTIMSIDADNNQEPDYAIYSNNTIDRPAVPPTRYDFVAFIPLGMSSHVNGAFFYPNTPIWKPRGWFEITETGLMFANQFELESNNFNTSESDTRNYRCIINGGYFTQMVRGRFNPCTKVKYYQIGGKAYVKEFYPGNHSVNEHPNTLVPVNVTGGEIEQCFMTGYGKGTAYGTDIYFWCAGGKIHKFLGAYMEPPVQTAEHTGSNPGTVDLTAKIDHAVIGRFFGGGTTSAARISGDINVTINNSRVDFYCGGPEFGDMTEGKTVTTHATNTTFGEYYGAGFGGTAITYKNNIDNGSVTLAATVSYPNYFSTYYLSNSSGRLHYLSGFGLGSCYKFEYLMHSRGHRGVARFFTGYASFSLATTGAVINELEGCTVLNSFYGAGCQGKVNGTVTSTLKDCTVLGSAFGGGYKAAANEVDVYPTTAPAPNSVFTGETGIFSDFGSVNPEPYKWEQGDASNQNTVSGTTLYTSKDIDLLTLGNVTGDITITLEGNTTVKGNVFGGGNESKSLSNTLVKILGHTKVFGNIYGGGNEGVVGGNTKVIVNGSVTNTSGSNPGNQD